MPCTVLGNVAFSEGGFGGQLVTDYVEDFQRVQPFLRRDPRKPEDWAALLAELKDTEFPRAELASLLSDSARQAGAADAALDNAKALAQPGVYAIVTGQQAGLFGGPLYSLHKALTAIKLAEVLNTRHGPDVSFVPIFWIAGDDHDFAEIDHADFVTDDGRVARIRAETPKETVGASVADVRIDAQVPKLEPELQKLIPDAAEELLAPYRKQNLSTAYAVLLNRWLSESGLVIVESTTVRRLGGAFYAEALRGHRASETLVREAGERMREAGYEPGFPSTPQGPFLFVSSNGIRARLAPSEDENGFDEHSPAFKARGLEARRHSFEGIEAAARAKPELFSSAAALRPVLQNRVFPVAATVLGPGEMAYWSQLGTLHDHYHAVWPMILPRASFTLLDAAGEKALRKLELDIVDLFLPQESRRAKAFRGGAVDHRITEGTERILAEFDDMHAEVARVDRGLESLFGKARSRISHELERIAKKTRASVAQRENAGVNRLNYLEALVQPRNRPQERCLCTAQFMEGHTDLAESLLEVLDPFAFEHRVVHLV